jgi:predicted RNase H-like HicB family nuclease
LFARHFLKRIHIFMESFMQRYTAIVERCQETGLHVGFIPGFQGAHTQAETLDELSQNLREVVEMLLDAGVTVDGLLKSR